MISTITYPPPVLEIPLLLCTIVISEEHVIIVNSIGIVVYISVVDERLLGERVEIGVACGVGGFNWMEDDALFFARIVHEKVVVARVLLLPVGDETSFRIFKSRTVSSSPIPSCSRL